MRQGWKEGTLAFTLGALLLAGCSTPPTPGAQAPDNVNLLGVVASDGTLAGYRLDLGRARVTRNGEPLGSGANLKPGMVVAVEGQASGLTVQVTNLDIRVELKGPIGSIDLQAGTLTVLGQEVQVDAMTQVQDWDGTSLALADLRQGDLVEVSGIRQGTTLLASRIERQNPGQNPEVEVKGFACGLDPQARTFALWKAGDCLDPSGNTGLTVNYANATLEGTPQESAPVEAKGTLQGSVLLAFKVEFKTSSNSPTSPQKMELYGPLSNLREDQQTFELLGFLVDYSQARIQGTLKEGSYVKVEGTLEGGRVLASKVEVKYSRPEGAPTGKAEGPIQNLDPSAWTFEVRGLSFYADGSTVVKQEDPDQPLTLSDLREGDWVEVKYENSQQNGRYHALKVERKGQGGGESGHEYEAEGLVANLDAQNRTFRLGSLQVGVTPNTEYKDDRTDRRLTAEAFWAQVQEGSRVEVKGTLSGQTLTATKIKLK